MKYLYRSISYDIECYERDNFIRLMRKCLLNSLIGMRHTRDKGENLGE